jgi:hypothetical protein
MTFMARALRSAKINAPANTTHGIRQDHAGQQQQGGAAFGRRAAAQVAPGQQVEHHRDDYRAGEGRRVDHPRGAHEHQRGQRADRRAGGDAQDIWVGQRIAQQRLHHDAGQRQRGAGDEGGNGAAQAQVEQGGRQGRGLAVQQVVDRCGNIGKGNRDRTGHARKNQAGKREQGQAGQSDGGALLQIA